MSFVLWIVSLFCHALASSAHLIDFVHAIDVSLALALAYSILLRLGSFSGATLNDWFDKERRRVLAPLAEDKRFNAARYETTLTQCRDRFQWFTRKANIFFMWWCIFASVGALTALILIPFHAQQMVPGIVVMQNAVLLAGPLPLGMITLGLTHIAARVMMTIHSAEGNTLIKHIAQTPAANLAAAKVAIGQPAQPPFTILGWDGKEFLKGLVAFVLGSLLLWLFLTH